ncbi:MAG: hypothetical protein KDJ72_08510 [Methyloceanibacter sp.]|uniref:hypothetical protein n=1 Tax=Methyloceanibacter sp. TaxID=1965321 RepID=UPI001D3DC17E|nr:hypothetical protein [Methyloceanibacter sp.]MCB1443051.1 hypothetical protein [Methyloceanibacter sp.]
MSDFVITYDLNNPGQNYAAVEKAIKACGEAGRVLETVWYLSSAMTGDQVLAKVWAAMDGTDRLLVVDARAAWGQNIGDRWNIIDRCWNSKAA